MATTVNRPPGFCRSRFNCNRKRVNNVAIVAVSIGLLSNALIAASDLSIKAREELHELFHVQEEIGHASALSLVAEVTEPTSFFKSGASAFAFTSLGVSPRPSPPLRFNRH